MASTERDDMTAEAAAGDLAALDAAARADLLAGLVALRVGCGLSQAQTAQRMGIGQATLAEFERRRHGEMRLSTLMRYARALGYRLHLELVRT